MRDIIVVLPKQSTLIDPVSSAFSHGFGLFETMRYADGKLYFWKDHWARISKSAAHFALDLPNEDSVLAALSELVSKAALKDSILKLSLVQDINESRLYVYSRSPLPSPESRVLLFDPLNPIFEHSALAGHKTNNYMEAMHLLHRARSQGYCDMLRVDSCGHLAETTTASLFFVMNGKLCTPSLKTGILPGIARGALIDSKTLNIEEDKYDKDVLRQAESVFLTRTTTGVERISKIEGIPGANYYTYKDESRLYDRVETAWAQLQSESAVQLC